MCLIIVAPKGTDKYSKLIDSSIDNGAETNDDGYGYCYKKDKDKQIYISKGYTDVKLLKESIKSKDLKPEDELLIHFRIGTSGKKDNKNCHPFVISESQDEILTIEGFVEKPVLTHNGVFGKYTEHQSDYSDTYHFTKRFISIPEVVALLNRDEVIFEEIFSGILGSNKLAILMPDRDLIKIGTFLEDEGYFFSNSCYNNSWMKNYGGYEEDTREYPSYGKHNTQKRIGFQPVISRVKKGGAHKGGNGSTTKPSLGASAGKPILSEFIITEDNFREIALKSTKTEQFISIGIEYYIDLFKDDDFNIAIYEKDNLSKIIIKSKVFCDEYFYIVPRDIYRDKYVTYNLLTGICNNSRNAVKKLGRAISSNYWKTEFKYKGQTLNMLGAQYFLRIAEAKLGIKDSTKEIIEEQREVIVD